MDYGAYFPTSELVHDPVLIRDFAQAAEDLGYSHIVVPDHVLSALHEGRDPPLTGPYTEDDAFHEPMVLCSYLAGATKRIHFETGVIIAPQRQTALLAKQAAELAILSGDRLRLGLGTGWNYVEYEGLGVDFSRRGAILDEQIALMRKLWSEPVVDFRGRFHRIDRAGLNPRPARSIPIWLGGFTRVALERAARVADGFLFIEHPESEAHASLLRDLLRQNGRDPGAFGMELALHFGRGPKAWRETADAWKALGASHITLRTTWELLANHGRAVTLTEPRQHIEALETFMNEMRGSS